MRIQQKVLNEECIISIHLTEGYVKSINILFYIFQISEWKGFLNNSSPVEVDNKKKFKNLKSQCYFRLAEVINRNEIFVKTHVTSNTLLGFGSVLMTYFGVNYYLSGLHSYASGDAIPVPKGVYVAVIIILILIVSAFLSNRFTGIKQEKDELLEEV